jgi:predicted RNA-binding Zn ribbon-like protein
MGAYLLAVGAPLFLYPARSRACPPAVRNSVNLGAFADMAVRLVNSAADGSDADPLRDASSVRELTGNGPFSDIPVTRHDLESLRALRADLGAVFAAAAADDGADVAARLNGLLTVYPLQPVIVSHDRERWHLHLAENGSLADRYAAAAVSSLALIVTQAGLQRLGVCSIAACGRVFLGNARSRRYCSEHSDVRVNVTAITPARPSVRSAAS